MAATVAISGLRPYGYVPAGTVAIARVWVVVGDSPVVENFTRVWSGDRWVPSVESLYVGGIRQELY